jgi:hypothetical protein
MYTFLDGSSGRNTRRIVRLFRWYFGIGSRGAETAVQRRLATPVESEVGGPGRR